MRWFLQVGFAALIVGGLPKKANSQALCQRCLQTCAKGSSALARRVRQEALRRVAVRQARKRVQRWGLGQIFGKLLLGGGSFSNLLCVGTGVATGGAALALCGAVVNHVASSWRENIDLQKQQQSLCLKTCNRFNLCGQKRRERPRLHSRGHEFQEEEEIVLKTVEALYNAWQEINFRAYFALWSPDAVRYNHWTGTRWDYDTIIRRRIKAFGMYRQVWTLYTCEVKSFQASRAGVECLYDWIGIYKRSGKKEAEYLTKEFYALEKSEGTWRIIENHDYSNYQGGMFQWQGERLPSKREKQVEKALRKEAVAYVERLWPTLRAAVDRGQIIQEQGSLTATLTVDRVLRVPQGSWLKRLPSVRLTMRSSDGLSWLADARRR